MRLSSLQTFLARAWNRRKAASGVDYAVLAALVAVAVLGAVVLTGERVRSLFVATEDRVGDGVAGLPLPQPPGGDPGTGGPPAGGQGAWSGDGTFVLSPLLSVETRTLTLTNTSQDQVLALGGAPAVSGPGAVAFQVVGGDCGVILEPGESCVVLVQASAAANGTATATLSVPGVPSGLPLSRVATGFDPMLAWSGPAEIAVSGAPGQGPLPRTATGTFVLQNQGFADATGVAPALSGSAGGVFSLGASNCPAVLPQGASCTVVVEASAIADGTAETRLVAGGASTAEIVVRMTAGGFAAQLSWSGSGAFVIGAPPSTPATVQQTLTLANTGTAPAAGIAPAVSGDAAFQIVSTTCGATLAPGADCAVTVSFTATADVSGASATLSTGPVAGRPVVALSGTASGIAPALAWTGTAPALDGTPPQALPVWGEATFTLANAGNQDASGLGAVSVAGPGWSLVSTTCGATLAQGATCAATLRLEATATGALPGTLSIAGGPSLALAGSAAGFAPALAWSGMPTFAIDGTPGPQPLPRTASQTFTLTNTGTAPATGLSVGVSGAGFAAGLPSTTCTTTLAAGESCTFTVVASASNNGAFVGTLSSGGAVPATQALSATATGFAPVWAWSGGGAFDVASPTATPAVVERTFTLTNVGTLAGAPAAPTVSGTGAGFAYDLVSTTCGAPLAVGTTCQAVVRATFTDNVAAAAGTLGGPATQALTGTASGFAPAWAFDAAPAGDFTITNPAAATESTSLTFTLRNTGTLAGTPPAREISGPAAADFALAGGTCGAASVAPGAACTVQVSFTASGNVSGRTATLAAGTASKALSGTASGFAPALAWVVAPTFVIDGTPSSLPLPRTDTQTFRLANTGTAPATDLSIAVSGAGFSLGAGTTCTTSLGVGQSCDVVVVASASANGPVSGSLTSGGTNAAVQALTGTASGFAPALAWSGTPTFAIDGTPGPQPLPRTASQTFTLTNTGTAPATGLSVGVSGAGFAAGLPSTTCTTTLAAGESCTFTVVASASNNGAFVGTLSSGGAAPATQALSATATSFAPLLSWSSDGASMDVVFPPGPVRTWTLTNVGTLSSDSLVGAVALLGENASAFDLLASTCGPVLPVGGTCTLQTRLSGALTAGTYSADLVASVPGGTTTTVSATVQADGTPNAFSFSALTGQPGNTVVSATPVRLTGFNTPVAVSATGGAEVSTDGGATWASSGILAPSAFLGVRVNTGTPDGGTRAIVVTAGGVSTTWNVGVVDQIPAAFSFASRTGEELNELAVSDPVTPTGYNTATGISVSGDGAPQISVGGGAFTTATTISPGQSVIVRLTSAESPNTTRTATVSVGGVSATWSVTTGGVDSVPLAFSVPALTNQAPGAVVISDAVTLTGFDAPLTLSVSGDGTPQVSSNNGATWASSLRLRPGQSFRVRMTAGPESTTRTATVDAGGVQATWSVTTRAQDTTPDAFSIANLTGQPGTTVVESASVTPVGYMDPTTISVSGDGSPQISVATGPWTTSATISPGQSFRVRMTSPDPDGLTRTVTVSIGGVSAPWSVTTVDTMPNPGGPFSVTNQLPGSCMLSAPFVFEGMTQPATFTAASQISGTGGTADGLTLVLTSAGTVHGIGRVINAGESWRFRACAPRGLLGQPSPEYNGVVRYTIGGRTYDVSWSTVAQDLSPDAVIPVPVSGATPGQMVVSDPFVITGVSGPIPIGFDSQFGGGPNGMEFSIDGGTTWSTATLVANGFNEVANGTAGRGILLPVGQPVRLRVVAPAAGQQVTSYLRYGVNGNPNYPGSFSFSAPWSVSSAAPDEMPNAWRDLSYTSTVAQIGSQIGVSSIVLDTSRPVGMQTGIFVEGINVPVQATIQRISTNSPGIPAAFITCYGLLSNSQQCFGASTITVWPGLRMGVAVGVPVFAGEEAIYRLTIGQRSQDFTVRAPIQDVTPDAFSIPAQAGVEPGTVITSDVVSVTGIEARTRIRVSGEGSPQVSVGGGSWTTDTSIGVGQTFRVRLTSAPVADGTVRTATVSIGVPDAPGQSVLTAPFVVTTADRTPDAVSFAGVSDVEPGALVESAPVTITGMGVGGTFSVSGGQASVNGGAYAASGSIANGQTVRLRLTAGSHGQARTATLTVGGLSAGFTATARALDTVPDAFTIPALTGQPAATQVQSAWVRPTGFLDPAPLTVVGGEVLLEGDTTWRTSGTLEPGQRFRVRLTSGAAGQTVTATVSVGGVEAVFSVTSGS